MGDDQEEPYESSSRSASRTAYSHRPERREHLRTTESDGETERERVRERREGSRGRRRDDAGDGEPAQLRAELEAMAQDIEARRARLVKIAAKVRVSIDESEG
jgi:hypothetical protein